MSRRLTTEEVIAAAREVHGDRYDYSKVNYTRRCDKICIICPEHGEFYQTSYEHTHGQGCYLCRNKKIGDSKRKSAEEFVRQAEAVFGNLYDYSLVEYKNNNTPVRIVCRKHGVFEKKPSKHLMGQGCQKCAAEAVVRHHTLGRSEWLQRFVKAHGDTYDYSLVPERVKGVEKVQIVCGRHGVFEQSPATHAKGAGCPECAAERRGAATCMKRSEFLEKALAAHGSKYIYKETRLADSKTPCRITCPTHGVFMQRPNDHLTGHGCPTCARITRGRSQAGVELAAYLRLLGEEVVQEARICPQKGERRWRSDCYIPRLKLHIEFNGLRWHSTRFQPDTQMHVKRQRLAEENGCRMVFIHEDEWRYNRDAVKCYLWHLLGKSDSVYARKCRVMPVDAGIAVGFYHKYHIQGCVQGYEVNLGLYHGEDLIACMSFSRKTSNRTAPYSEGLWELVRFACKNSVVGGATKLFKHFVAEYKPQRVVSFSLNHLFTGKVYETMGFKLDKILRADYQYVDTKNVRRLHKSNFQHRRLAERFEDYDATLTEEQNCAKHNLYRIYDCGKKRWVWTNV